MVKAQLTVADISRLHCPRVVNLPPTTRYRVRIVRRRPCFLQAEGVQQLSLQIGSPRPSHSEEDGKTVAIIEPYRRVGGLSGVSGRRRFMCLILASDWAVQRLQRRCQIALTATHSTPSATSARRHCIDKTQRPHDSPFCFNIHGRKRSQETRELKTENPPSPARLKRRREKRKHISLRCVRHLLPSRVDPPVARIRRGCWTRELDGVHNSCNNALFLATCGLS